MNVSYSLDPTRLASFYSFCVASTTPAAWLVLRVFFLLHHRMISSFSFSVSCAPTRASRLFDSIFVLLVSGLGIVVFVRKHASTKKRRQHRSPRMTPPISCPTQSMRPSVSPLSRSFRIDDWRGGPYYVSNLPRIKYSSTWHNQQQNSKIHLPRTGSGPSEPGGFDPFVRPTRMSSSSARQH